MGAQQVTDKDFEQEVLKALTRMASAWERIAESLERMADQDDGMDDVPSARSLSDG